MAKFLRLALAAAMLSGLSACAVYPAGPVAVRPGRAHWVPGHHGYWGNWVPGHWG